MNKIQVLCLSFGLLLLSSLMVALVGCADSGVKSKEGESCTKTADCGSGLRCVGQVCVKDTTLTWVSIPAGSYQMGCSPGDTSCGSDENPVHTVNVPAFDILEHEVTQGEYQAVIGNNPSNFISCGLDCPVEKVSWDEAKAYCVAIGGRLPSESEWEYAARGKTTTKWYCGDDESCVTNIAWYYSNSGDTTHPAKQKAANGFGLYDMIGNVWEWVEDDWQGNYTGAPSDGSAWICSPSRDSSRVVRGGSWVDAAGGVSSSNRGNHNHGGRYYNDGFRCSRD